MSSHLVPNMSQHTYYKSKYTYTTHSSKGNINRLTFAFPAHLNIDSVAYNHTESVQKLK